MELLGRTALVTGANRGLGRHLAQQLVARGATVYAGARNPDSVDLVGAIPLQLDVTDPASIASAATIAENVSVLINNAGSFTGASLADAPWADIELEMNTHYFGPLAIVRSFAPQLAQHQSSAILNILSIVSWVTYPGYSAYAAAKSAAWSMTSALRQELAGQGTQVSALHASFIDTDMVRHVDAPKSDPATVARLALDGLEAGRPEIVVDDQTRQIQAALAGGVPALYPQFA